MDALSNEDIKRTVSVAEACEKLDDLIDETSSSHQPVAIEGKHSKGVLISDEQWRDVRETLYLQINPRDGRVDPPRPECSG